MGILNFTILSLGLVFFIKILVEIYTGALNEFNKNGTVPRERKKEGVIVAITIVFTMILILATDGFTKGERLIIAVLLTPITYSIYKSIKYLVAYVKNNCKNKEYIKRDRAKGWKVVPFGERRVSEFGNRNELEIYRIHTLIKNILKINYGCNVNTEDYRTINVNYDDFRLEITLEVLNSKINKNVRKRFLDIKFKKEGEFYLLLKNELLPYTHMLDGNSFKLGNNTLIARVDYCDIKVNIKRCA